MTQDLNQRIAELEAQIAPLQEELRKLRNLAAKRYAAQRSAEVRRAKKADRDKKIKKELLARYGAHSYKRGDGLIAIVAKQFGVSERTIGRLWATVRPDKYKNSFVKNWS